MSANEYPIDTDVIDKGSVISAEQIETIFGVSRDHRAYGLAVLKLRGYITFRLAERGLNIVCREHKGAIHVLIDDDAVDYTDAAFHTALDRMGRHLLQQQQVDRGKLSTPEKLRSHDRRLIVNGATYVGAKSARVKALAPLRPTPRLTPGKK